jgi:inosine-uridine nucleoside N-ribohydrolase
VALLFATLYACKTQDADQDNRIPVLFDTDANNELDDQHALAYLLFNEEVFNTVGITVNATRNGGGIEEQVEEALRVIKLCNMEGKVPLKAGADGNFPEILPQLGEASYDGKEAVDFIIAESMKKRDQKLLLLPVGKLTNIALALVKEPAIAERVEVLWLGANYPAPGEYNLDNDTAALNYILDHKVPFDLALVRYGEPSGTAAVLASQTEINERMPGKGPYVEEPVEGRHGESFHTFGDYSVNLFEHIEYYDEGKHRSLFDMAAVAIVKNPEWAKRREIPAPLYVHDAWQERPGNPRKIGLWEHFDRDLIMQDFYASFP